MSSVTTGSTGCGPEGPQERRWRKLAERLEPVTAGGGLTFVVLLAMANLGNLVFHVIASHRLGLESYGALGALLALMSAVSLPAASLQVSVTKAAGERIAARTAFSALDVAVKVAAIAAAAALSIMVASPAIKDYLELTSTRPVIWAAAFLVPAFVGAIARGVLLAELRFSAAAGSMLAGTALKAALALLVLDADSSVSTAIGINVLSELVLTVLLLGLARSRMERKGRALRVPWRDTAASTFALSGLWAMLAADLVLARHYLTAANSGEYVAGATVARAVLFIPQSISLVAHARMISAGPAEVRHILRSAMIATIAVSGGVVTALVSTSWFMIPLLFGPEFTPPTAMVAVLALTAGLLAVTNLFVHHRLAIGVGVQVVWLGLAVLWTATLIGHGSSVQIALAASVGAGAAVLVTRPRSLRSPAGPDQPTHRALPVADIDVSVILAAVDDITPVVDRARSVAACLLDADREFEIIVATPRSNATAIEQLAGLDRSQVQVLILDQGNTKGAALQAGAAAAIGRHVVFLDPEPDISVSHIPQYMDLLSFYTADVVVGSKRHPDSLVHYPPLRRIYSWAYQQLVRGLFRLSVRDLRVGLKVFTRETIIDALPHTTNKSFVFELELLSIARKAGHRRIVEAPVAIDKRFSSAVSIGTTVRELAATIVLRTRLPRLHHGVPHYPEHGRPAPGTVPEPFRWPIGSGSALVQK